FSAVYQSSYNAPTREMSPCFFFFQAEDGIRDGHVTGVQTCALPIFADAVRNRRRPRGRLQPEIEQVRRHLPGIRNEDGEPDPARSEERRVGKECRSRGLAEYVKK